MTDYVHTAELIVEACSLPRTPKVLKSLEVCLTYGYETETQLLAAVPMIDIELFTCLDEAGIQKALHTAAQKGRYVRLHRAGVSFACHAAKGPTTVVVIYYEGNAASFLDA